jgi:hypothetical protein
MRHTLSELTGPVYGHECARENDHDLTMQHRAEPLGERIIVQTGTDPKVSAIVRPFAPAIQSRRARIRSEPNHISVKSLFVGVAAMSFRASTSATSWPER